MTQRNDTLAMTLDGITFERILPAEVSAATLVDHLSRVPFLAPVPRPLLEGLVGQVPVHRYEGGRAFIRQGEFGHSLYVLIAGGVVVSLRDEAGAEHVVATSHAPGTIVGEGGVLGRRRRSATCTTVQDSLLLEIDKTRLERLDMEVDGAIFEILEEQVARRSIEEFVQRHRFFAQMSLAGQARVAEGIRLRVYERGQRVFHRGERAETVYIVKAGTAQFVGEADDAQPVLTYFSVGDAIGFVLYNEPGRAPVHAYDLVSRGYLELFEIDYAHLQDLPEHDREILRQFQKDDVDRLPSLPHGSADDTVDVFGLEILREGAQEGLSLLTIDLDTCIRCGNCVRACQERHGHARFTRQGEKLVRRVDPTDDSRHHAVLIPASCRHCVNPECMIGCPTGAIHREPGGEVVIEDTCIGCGSCASRCPWDNITMVATPGRLVPGDPQPRDLIANKCDLCEGYDQPNCVHNCPTGAILRIEPTSFYPELRALLGRTGQEPAGESVAQRPRDHARWVVPATLALVAAGAVALRALAGAAYSPWSPTGMALGGGALVAMLGALSLAARRRLARLPRRAPRRKPRRAAEAAGAPAPPKRLRAALTQLGAFRTWARFHVWVGALSFLLLLLHCDGRAGGPLTAALLLLTSVEVAVGVFGVVFGRWMPRVVTRLEGGAQVEESVVQERGQIQERLGAIREAMEPAERIVHDLTRRRVGGPWRRLARHARFGLGGRLRARADQGGPPDFDARVAAVCAELRPRAANLSRSQRRVQERLAADLVRLVDLRACQRLYDIRRGWLAVHIGVAGLLAALVCAHVVSTLGFHLLACVGLLGGGAP